MMRAKGGDNLISVDDMNNSNGFSSSAYRSKYESKDNYNTVS